MGAAKVSPEKAIPEKAGPERVKSDKLVIVGTAPNRKDAPFGDMSKVIWGTGGVVNAPDVPRVDAIFELHPKRYWLETPGVLDVLKAYTGVIYMQDVYPEVPGSVRFPVEKVQETFYMPTMGRSLYITNTVSFMFALGYLAGFREIETWGMYMEHETEYGYQKPNCEFFVGFLHAKGIRVTINGGDVLKAQFLYGYEEPDILGKLIDDGNALTNGKKQFEDEIREKERALWMQEGGIRYNKDLRKKFGGY